MSITRIFAENLQKLIPEGEIKEFAAKHKLGYHQLVGFRSGQRDNPQLKTIFKIAHALGVPAASLIDESDPGEDQSFVLRDTTEAAHA